MAENIDIIISRFNEDLTWSLEEPFNKFKYIVYNKGENDDFEKGNVKNIIKLNNLGKNDHTYLYHIIENYHNLSNITIFFPGSLNIEYKKTKAIRILNRIIETNYKKAFFLGHYQNNVCESFKYFQLDNWQTSDSANLLKCDIVELKKCRLRPYYLWYNYFFGKIKATWSTWWGIFSIDKRDIIKHPITRYQELILTVNDHYNPEAGHYIERSWGAIFFPLLYTMKEQE
jgi:hypothetical protein